MNTAEKIHRKPKILFICKKNETYGFTTYTRRSSGLFNSTRFIAEGLRDRDVDAHIVEVIDNNCIDREVSKYRPDIVIIEALWVVPEKFEILKRFHPKVKWFIHMHSGFPFLAQEGIAMEWVFKCAKQGIKIIANSPESYEAYIPLIGQENLVFLPNVYITDPEEPVYHWPYSQWINVGCFGAVRPMKNHLLQAMAAIQFARDKGKKLLFHFNVSRIEVGGNPVLKNLIHLFAELPDAQLVECPWMEPDEFIDYLNENIDIGMQVSMTETFNVVTADYVTAGLPIVVSKEVAWASKFCMAKDDDITDIVSKMHRVYGKRWLVTWNQILLNRNSQWAQRLWFAFVKENTKN